MKIIEPYSNLGITPVVTMVLDQIDDCNSLMDVGCANGNYLNWISDQRPKLETCGIDGYAPVLQSVRATKVIHGILPFSLEDKSFNKSYDAVMCLDVVEHLHKVESIQMVKRFDNIARKKIVIFTPFGFLDNNVAIQEDKDWQPWLFHKCGWYPEEFEALGYETYVWKNFDYGAGRVHDALWAVKEL